jgi:hypothetical protein
VVEDLVMRALAKDPDDRYPNMAEFEAAIQSTAFESTICHLNPLELEEIDETIVWAERGRQFREATPPPMVIEVSDEDIVDETEIRMRPEPPPMMSDEPACDLSAFTTVPPPSLLDANPPTFPPTHPPTYPPTHPPTYPPEASARAPMSPMALYPTYPPAVAANPATGRHTVVRNDRADTGQFALHVPRRERSKNALVIAVSTVAAVCVVSFALVWTAVFGQSETPRPEVYAAAVMAQPRAVAIPPPALGDAPAFVDPVPDLPMSEPNDVEEQPVELVRPAAQPAARATRTVGRSAPRESRNRPRSADGLASARAAIRACGREHGAIAGTNLQVTFDVLGGRASSIRVQKPHAVTPLGRCVATAISSHARFAEDAPNVSRTVSF